MSYFSKLAAKQSINHYSRKDTNHHIKGSDTAANRRTLVIVPIAVDIDDRLGSGRLDRFTTLVDIEIDLNTDTYWDKKNIAATWTAKTYALNNVAKPTVANNYIYLCTTPGASGASEPTWGTIAGGTTTDGAAIWTCYKDYTIPINRAGVNFYIYACMQPGTVPLIRLSASSTYPLGYTANNSRKIGGFHAMPYVTAPTWLADTATVLNYVVQPTVPNANSRFLYKCTARDGDYKTDASTQPTWPTTLGETVVDDQVTWTCVANGSQNLVQGTDPYYGFLMGDILFNSIWDLLDAPRSAPEGMAKISLTPSDGKPATWVDIYLANGTGTTITSLFGVAIKTGILWDAWIEVARLQGKRLLRDHEFQIAATGSNEATNIAGSANPVNVTFPVDTAGRSMISFYGIIGMCGVWAQSLDEQTFRFDGAANHTHDTVVSGEAQTATSGNPSADVAPAWSALDMSSKGRRYHQGTYGDVKMTAGMGYSSGVLAGSRGRMLDQKVNSGACARFCSNPV